MTVAAFVLDICDNWYNNLLFVLLPLVYVAIDYLVLGLSFLSLGVMAALSVALTYIIDFMEFSIEYDKKLSYGRYAFRAVLAAVIIKLIL